MTANISRSSEESEVEVLGESFIWKKIKLQAEPMGLCSVSFCSMQRRCRTSQTFVFLISLLCHIE
jgi:hypothetical protein